MGTPADAEQYLREVPGYVDAMFSGKKAGLRPIYEELLQLAFTLGRDVTVSPGKTIIPFYRHHVFAQVKPTTQTRVDLGLCLRGVNPRDDWSRPAEKPGAIESPTASGSARSKTSTGRCTTG
jgi:hypothetical protein